MYKNVDIITRDQIKELRITAKEKYEWVDNVIKNKNKYILPVKTRIPLNSSDYFNVMPCVLPPENILGVKVVTRNTLRREKGGDNIDGDILLYSYDDFMPTALIDGGYITTIRTAAVAVHSMMNLIKLNQMGERKLPLKIAMIGLGKIGTEIGNILFELYKDKHIIVKLFKYKGQDEIFMNKFSNYSNVQFEQCDSIVSLMSDSDVIFSSVTYAEDDFCSPSIYKDKCIVFPVHLRGFRECDKQFDTIITSDLESIKKFKYYNEMKNLLYIDDVIIGNDKNECRGGKIVVYNLGLAIYDLYFANQILKKYLK